MKLFLKRMGAGLAIIAVIAICMLIMYKLARLISPGILFGAITSLLLSYAIGIVIFPDKED